MTPQEMADWLEAEAKKHERANRPCAWLRRDAAICHRIVAYLRRQPTDAQKMEALQAERLAVMCRMGGALDDEFCQHGEALRLLGLLEGAPPDGGSGRP